MGKTATGGAKATTPSQATAVLAGALGCFVAGYGAHALGGATKSIQKAVQTRLPASLKTMLPSLGFATPRNKRVQFKLWLLAIQAFENKPFVYCLCLGWRASRCLLDRIIFVSR